MGTRDEERAARLAAALRDNLRRRKEQLRASGADKPQVPRYGTVAGLPVPPGDGNVAGGLGGEDGVGDGGD